MCDELCKKCLRNFNYEVTVIKLGDGRLMSADYYSRTFNGCIQIEGKLFAYIDENGNIRSIDSEEIVAIVVCKNEVSYLDDSKVNNLENQLTSFHI